MPTSTTLTIRLSPKAKDHLARLSRAAEMIRGIERGLADLKTGRVVPHKKAMAELDAVIEKAARRRK